MIKLEGRRGYLQKAVLSVLLIPTNNPPVLPAVVLEALLAVLGRYVEAACGGGGVPVLAGLAAAGPD